MKLRFDVQMPDMGSSITEATITKWLVNVGDRVERDQPLFELATEKVDAEIPSPSNGVLSRILYPVGSTVPIHTVVAWIESGAPGAPTAFPLDGFPRGQTTLLKNRSMPSSVVIPVLAYPDVREAVAWLCRSLGFVERLRIGDHRAQLSFGDGSIVVAGQQGGPGASDFNHSVMVRVADIDNHYEHVRKSGARIISPPTNYPYGERQYTVEDLGGHRWTFSQTITDVDPKVWGGTLIE